MKGRPKGDQVTLAGVKIGIGPLGVVAAGENIAASERGTQQGLELGADGWGAHRTMVDDMDIDQADLVQRLGQAQVQGIGFGIGHHTVEHAVRGDAHADPVGANRARGGPSHFDGETDPVLDGAAPSVGPLVGGKVKELIDEIAVGAVQFHAIEVCRDGVPASLGEFVDSSRDVGLAHGFGNRVGLQALEIGPHLAGRRRCRWRHDPRACGQVGGMANTTGMHQLRIDPPSRLMYGMGDLTPARDLCFGKEPWDARIPEAIG